VSLVAVADFESGDDWSSPRISGRDHRQNENDNWAVALGSFSFGGPLPVRISIQQMLSAGAENLNAGT
jgi:hypothetical protein